MLREVARRSKEYAERSEGGRGRRWMDRRWVGSRRGRRVGGGGRGGGGGRCMREGGGTGRMTEGGERGLEQALPVNKPRRQYCPTIQSELESI